MSGKMGMILTWRNSKICLDDVKDLDWVYSDNVNGCLEEYTGSRAFQSSGYYTFTS